MIAGYHSKPVFQYQFRPLMNAHRAPDGGFCVLLYENGILSFSTYDTNGVFMDEICFVLTARVVQIFYSLLRGAAGWLYACPCDLRASSVTPYASSFAFDGYDPVRIWGLKSLLAEPPGSEAGYFARHMVVLFEDIASLLAEHGIRLTLDGFTWDPQKVSIFRKRQMYYSGQQGVV